VPFLLFHFRPKDSTSKLSDAIIKSINLFDYFSAHSLNYFYQYGLIIYVLGCLGILAYLMHRKFLSGIYSLFFFMTVYSVSFLVLNNEFKSYVLLIVSHAIPYYFLMEKRIIKTHSISNVRKYAPYILMLIFIIGGLIDYNQDEITQYFAEVDIIIRAMLVTPLIAHFIFDAVIWKSGNERFKKFLSPT
jgi:hypothetical protein